MKSRQKTYEGLQEGVRKLKLSKIEVWENKYRDKNYSVSLDTNEFTCICPKTGLPDFASLKIEYEPDRSCIELKSFKLYLHAFRNIGIFHEHAANRILDDFVRASRPFKAYIRMEFFMRGGIRTTVERRYER